MRILTIHGAGDVRLDPKPPPQPGERDVVIAVKACGICGSDLSYIRIGGIPPGPGRPRDGRSLEGGRPRPAGRAARQRFAPHRRGRGHRRLRRRRRGPGLVNDVIGMAKEHARLVITAAYMQPSEIHLGAMLTTEMTITTAMGYPDEMPEVVAALPRLRAQADVLISHRMPFDRVIEALDVAADPQSAKVMIGFGDG